MTNTKASAFTTQTNFGTTDILPFIHPGSPNTNNNITYASMYNQMLGRII
jgi:hypothetical protein